MSMINLNDPYYGEVRGDNGYNGKTITFQADVYSNYTSRIIIYTLVEGVYSHNRVNISPNTAGTYSVTRTVPLNTDEILFRVEPLEYSYENSFCYMDNLKINIQ